MRVIATFFMLAWGILFGAVFAGFAIGIGNHPAGLAANIGFALLAGAFSSMGCLGMGRMIGAMRFGKILNAIACATIALVFIARIAGWLPV